ncbi:MAG: MFS transporter [Chlamydiota bacterium]
MSNKKFLLFGCALTFFSTFGQTAFLSIFTPYIEGRLALSASASGLIYMIATLMSAILLSLTGKFIDAIDLKIFTRGVIILFTIACLSMVFAHNFPMLVIAYFLLRYSCQGLMTHTSMVSMARYFDDKRGQALSFAALGYPLGNATLPLLGSWLLKGVGFQYTWWLCFAIALMIVGPLLNFLLDGKDGNYTANLSGSSNSKLQGKPHLVWKDWKFYLVVAGVLAPPLINTGVFFQQKALLASKGWSLELYASSMIVFAIGNVLGSLVSGKMIDKYKATRLMVFYLLPMAAALVLLINAVASYNLYVFMLGIGITQGGSSVIIGAVWAELYGASCLGAVRSWVSALKVFATSVAPFIFGYLIDCRVGFSQILEGSVLFTLLSALSLGVVSLKSNEMKDSVAGVH